MKTQQIIAMMLVFYTFTVTATIISGAIQDGFALENKKLDLQSQECFCPNTNGEDNGGPQEPTDDDSDKREDIRDLERTEGKVWEARSPWLRQGNWMG